MSKIKNFETLIKSYYNESTDNMDCSPDTFERIEEKIRFGEEMNTVHNSSVFSMFNFKKVAIASLCCAIVMCGGIFTFSGSARVWAKEKLGNATSMIYKLIYTDDGYKPVQVAEEDEKPLEKPILNETIMPDSEFSKAVGFKVNFPAQLEGGTTLYSKAWYSYKNPNDTLAYSTYIKDGNMMGGGEYYLLEQFKSSIHLSNYYNVEPVKIGDIDGYWCESPNPIYPGDDYHYEPTGIDIYHYLYWVKDGVYNFVISSEQPSNKQLPKEKVLDFAKSVINAKDTPYEIPQVYINYLTWNPYMYNTPKMERLYCIEDRVKFSFKIPEKLADSYPLIKKGFICKLPENFKTQYTEDVWNLIGASYGSSSSNTPIVNLVISDRSSIVSDWETSEKISLKKVTAYYGKQSDKDFTASLDENTFPDYKVNTESHFIAWKDGGIYYKLYMESGDFSSRDEAKKYAQSVIKSVNAK